MAHSPNQAEIQNQFRTLAGGVATAPIPDPVTLDGASYTRAHIAQVIQASIEATDAAVAAKAAAAQALEKASTARAEALRVRSAVRTLVLLQQGKTSPVLASLGFVKEPTPLTVAAKAVAVDRGKATRAARHTMGSAQKAKITGLTTPAASASATGSGSGSGAELGLGGGSVAGTAAASSAPVAPGK